jgi:hypothetical protein
MTIPPSTEAAINQIVVRCGNFARMTAAIEAARRRDKAGVEHNIR